MTEDKKTNQPPNLGQPFGPQHKNPAPSTPPTPPTPPAQPAASAKQNAANDDDTLEIASPGAAFAGGISGSPTPPGFATTQHVGTPHHPQPPKTTAEKAKPGSLPQSPPAPKQAPASRQEANIANPGLTQGHAPKAAAKKVSPQQAQSISSKLKAGSAGLSENQSKRLIESLESGELPPPGEKKTTSVASGLPDAVRRQGTGHDRPSDIGPVHGVALFNGPVITLTTPEPLTTGDEIIIRNHRYQLKAGKASSKGSTFILAAALTIAAFLAGQYFANDQARVGPSIVGIALDKKGFPANSGAVVRLPELGLTTYTDENGFFSFENVPSGTYKIEYTLSGSSHGGQARVSVSEGTASLVTLAYEGKKVVSSRKKKSNRTASSATKNSRESKTSNTSRALSDGVGSLAVTSGTSGAKVYLDGKSLGAVNNTFRRIRAGKRTIRIEKSGYQSLTVLVNVNPGKIARLDIDLEPVRRKQKEVTTQQTLTSSSAAANKSLSAGDLYQMGRDLFNAGDLKAADRRFDQALAKNPSMADAYFMKAEIASARGNEDRAFKHYLKAGEIWLAQRRHGDALAALDNAVEQNPDNPLGYKVRADIYHARGHSTIAVDDYEQALKIDNKYYGARLALGITLLEKGSSRRAKKELRRAKDVNNQDPVLYHYLMLASLARNDQNDVNNYFRQFKQIASEADMTRFYGDAKLAKVRQIIKD